MEKDSGAKVNPDTLPCFVVEHHDEANPSNKAVEQLPAFSWM
jgi:hypothetical protein